MAFIPVPGAAAGAVIMVCENQFMQCEVDMTIETESAENVAAASEALYNAWNTHIMPQLSSGVALQSTVVFGLSDLITPVGVTFPPTLSSGGVSSPTLPNNVALCITKYTAFRGKSFRGRFYLPGIPDNARNGANQISDAYRGNLQTALNGMLAELISAGYPPAVVSRYANKAPRTTGIATHIVSWGPRDLVLDSQRRRLPGRGQ